MSEKQSGVLILDLMLIAFGVAGMVWLSSQSVSAADQQAANIGVAVVFALSQIPLIIFWYALEWKSRPMYILCFVLFGLLFAFEGTVAERISGGYTMLHKWSAGIQ